MTPCHFAFHLRRDKRVLLQSMPERSNLCRSCWQISLQLSSWIHGQQLRNRLNEPDNTSEISTGFYMNRIASGCLPFIFLQIIIFSVDVNECCQSISWVMHDTCVDLITKYRLDCKSEFLGSSCETVTTAML